MKKELYEWCEENFYKYDLAKPIDEEEIYQITQVMDTRKENINVGRVFYVGNSVTWDSIGELVPLLELRHLVNFAYIKGYGKVDFEYTEKGYDIFLLNRNSANDNKCLSWNENSGITLLECLFDFICEIVLGGGADCQVKEI